MFADDLLAMVLLSLDENNIAYKDEDSFAADTGLVL